MDKIDREQIYCINSYSFKNYVILSEKEKIDILSWRNHLNNRKWMFNPNIIPLEDHCIFIENLRNKEDSYYWEVLKNEEPIGGISLIHVDYEKEIAEIGYFLDPDKQGGGIGLDFLHHIFLFIFNILDFQVIEGNVRDSNVVAYTLNAFLGFEYLDKYVQKIEEEEEVLFHYGILRKEDFYRNIEVKNSLDCFIQFYKSKKNNGNK